MKKINQIIRKYFEPAFLDTKTSLRIIVHSICDVFLDRIFVLLFVPVIIQKLSDKQLDEALFYSLTAFILFAVLFLFRSRYTYYWYFPSDIKYDNALQKKYLPVILATDPNTFERNGTGYHLSKFNSGVKALTSNTREFLFNAPAIVVVLVISTILIFSLHVLLGIIFLFVISVFTYITVKVFSKEVELLEPVTEMSNQLHNTISRLIMSKAEILYSGKIRQEVENVSKRNEERFGVEKSAFRYSMWRHGSIWYSPIYTLLILLVCQSLGYLDLSIAQLTLLILLSNTLIDVFTNLFKVVGNMFENTNSIQAFFEMVNEEKIKNYNTGETFEHKNGEVEMQNVSFAYDNKSKILDNFNLLIKAKEKVALVGRSGSGKSTIAKLVTAYMHPDEGQVLADGQDLSKLMIKSYYKYIGYLTQDPMVFDGTVKENLMYSVSDKVTQEGMEAALTKAECQFILNSKDGLNTKIGERGVRLSGGEKQRLAIAKLFLKNPEIIILDEPTSALDSFSEDLITKALNELFLNRTVIIIAHRLQTVKKADRILVMENGKIVEEGTHDGLVSKNGTYAKMLELQSGI